MITDDINNKIKILKNIKKIQSESDKFEFDTLLSNYQLLQTQIDMKLTKNNDELKNILDTLEEKHQYFRSKYLN